jgi:bacteriocin biosynthesis cyclodehydratase domain-containing protein
MDAMRDGGTRAWVASPHWTLFVEDERLIASAGGDAHYLVDEASPAEAHALAQAFAAGRLGALAPSLEPLVAKLAALGALVHAGSRPEPTLAWSLRGPEPLARAVAELGRTEAGAQLERVEEGAAQLIVLVRTRGTLLELLDEAGPPLEAPHLLLDLAYQRTIALGPLVFPGETACLSCLAGRIRRAWGDPPPPAAPEAAQHVGLAAALVRQQLATFAREGSCPALVERTVAYDLATLESRGERVHRLPWCPRCFPPEQAYGTGQFALPWVRA